MTLMVEASVITAAIIAAGELFKNLNIFNPKYIPIINILLGVILSIIYGADGIKIDIFNGIIAGLTASGLYSGVKNVKQAVAFSSSSKGENK